MVRVAVAKFTGIEDLWSLDVSQSLGCMLQYSIQIVCSEMLLAKTCAQQIAPLAVVIASEGPTQLVEVGQAIPSGVLSK